MDCVGSCIFNDNNLICQRLSCGFYQIQWVIKDYLTLLEIDGCKSINSPSFFTGTAPPYEWKLVIFPNGRNKTGLMHLSIYIQNANKTPTTVTCSFSVMKANRELFGTMSFKGKEIQPGSTCGFPCFLPRKLVTKELSRMPQKALVLVCQLQVYQDINDMCVCNHIPQFKTLSENFEKLLSSSEFSDATIIVGGKEMKVHRAILAARSPVFYAMLKHDFEENKSNVIHIVDVKPDVMEAVILFIYSGKCPKLKEMVKDILPVSDKYNIDELKKMCEDILYNEITEENAMETLNFAVFFNANTLKSRALEFISKNKLVAMEEFGCETLALSHQHLELGSIQKNDEAL